MGIHGDAWASREFCQKGGDIWVRTRRQRKGNEAEGIPGRGNSKAIKIWSNTRLQFLRTSCGPGVLSTSCINSDSHNDLTEWTHLFVQDVKTQVPKDQVTLPRFQKKWRHSEDASSLSSESSRPNSAPSLRSILGLHNENSLLWLKHRLCKGVWREPRAGWESGSEESFHASTADQWRQAEHRSV